jgi:hypothetical protein
LVLIVSCFRIDRTFIEVPVHLILREWQSEVLTISTRAA